MTRATSPSPELSDSSSPVDESFPDPSGLDVDLLDATSTQEDADEETTENSDEDPRRLLLVVGSGRSGTSVMSGVMQRLGFHVPQPEVLADQTNPKGFGEPQWVVDFHTSLLRRLAVQTTDARPDVWSRTGEVAYDLDQRQHLRDWLTGEFAQADKVIIKDPRLLWFIQLWTRAAQDLGIEPRFVTMLRHPSQVVASKERWYDNLSNPPNRLAGWVNTMLYTERATRNSRRAFVIFDDLISDWTRSIARLDEDLDLWVLREVRLRHMQAVADLIDPDLKRSQETWEDLEVPTSLTELAEQVWRDVVVLAEDDPDSVSDVPARLDSAREEYGRLYADAEAIALSSVLAAQRAGRRTGESAAKRAAQATPAVPTPPPSPTLKSQVRKALGRLGRAVPAGVKELVPESIKGPLRRRLA